MAEMQQRLKELVETLNRAAYVYEQEDREIMSNYEYDKLYDELKDLEKKTGIVLAGSPTMRAGYEVLSVLPKERHETPMLSLDKTKDIEVLKETLGTREGVLSWKLDGLTVVLTYRDGELFKAVTRGNGEVGEVITNNAKAFQNIPLMIPYKGELILRGEAVIRYSDFEQINSQIEDIESRYKNPRNLCSGAVRQLNSEITAKRKVNFIVFSLIQIGGEVKHTTRDEQMQWIENQGFEVVERRFVTADTVEEAVRYFEQKITTLDFPSDGLVLLYNDIAYGLSLGRTSKFPRDSMAFKWKDEVKDTKLLSIEWSPSRTGLINPIAVFEPVELEGTTVSRASLHNISIMEGLELGTGDIIQVYKANMIIPQVAENLTRSGVIEIPVNCPVCNGKTIIKNDNDIKVLFCDNEECLAKKIKSFTHFTSRDAMNIEGLSEATIEKLIAKGVITELADIFHVEKYKDIIKQMEGFGERSYENLTASIEKARNTTLPKFIYSLGIPNIGLSNAKLICKECHYDLDEVMKADQELLLGISGVGDVIADAFVLFFKKESNIKIVEDLRSEITFESVVSEGELIFTDKTFVITGSVLHYPNRNALKESIEAMGGKVAGSVSAKTNYLINNDNLSNSSKNKKAKDLNIPIITEEEFMKMLTMETT